MKLTRDFIMQHRTPRGAWNKPQLELIGVTWPPAKGWVDRCDGMEIPDAIAERFAALATIKHKARIPVDEPELPEWMNEMADAPRASDKHVDAVRNKLRDRMRVGFRKYGVTTERCDLTRKDWLRHAQEEAMDLCVYLERLIQDEE